MIDLLPTVLTVLALVGAAWAVALIAMNKPLLPVTKPKLGLAAVLALLEAGLLAQAVIGIVKLTGLDREIDKFSFVGYLVGPVVILPLALMWSAAERTRWSGGALAIACLSVPVMIVRLGQIWAGHA